MSTSSPTRQLRTFVNGEYRDAPVLRPQRCGRPGDRPVVASAPMCDAADVDAA